MRWLQGYAFPGNIRELRNILERACLLSDGDEIDLRHLPAGSPAQLLRSTPEKAKISPSNDLGLAELASGFSGSRQALAAHLGLSERTLYRRLKALEKSGES
jgi:transcriptional regulator of acetoin/glycerol metabolism